MQTTEKRILEKAQIEQIIRRMAYEIYEQNYDASKIFLAGIDNNGVKISEMLAREVRAISEIPVELIRIDIDKEAQSQPTVSFSKEPDVPNFTLIVVDDVLNSGRTMIYALDPFLKMKVNFAVYDILTYTSLFFFFQFTIAVLVFLVVFILLLVMLS